MVSPAARRLSASRNTGSSQSGSRTATCRINRRARSRSPARSSAIARLSRVAGAVSPIESASRNGASASWKRPAASRSTPVVGGRTSIVMVDGRDGEQQAGDVGPRLLPDDRAIHPQHPESGGTNGFVNVMFAVGCSGPAGAAPSCRCRGRCRRGRAATPRPRTRTSRPAPAAGARWPAGLPARRNSTARRRRRSAASGAGAAPGR